MKVKFYLNKGENILSESLALVRNKKTGDIQVFPNPNEVVTYLLGRDITKYSIYVSISDLPQEATKL